MFFFKFDGVYRRRCGELAFHGGYNHVRVACSGDVRPSGGDGLAHLEPLLTIISAPRSLRALIVLVADKVNE